MDGTDNQVTLTLALRARDEATKVIKAVEGSILGLTGPVNVALIAFGALSLGVMAFGTGAAVRFQDSMEQIHTQAGASQAAVDSLTGSVEKLAMSPVGLSADELSKGLYHIESAMQGVRGQTLSNAKAMDMLKSAAEGARVGHANLEVVANALVGVLVSQIAGINGSADAMAKLNAVVGTGNVRFEDLAASIGTGVLPVFKSAGLTFQDWGAAMATATDNAMSAEVASTRLRMTISLMESPSANAIKQLNSIGLSSTQLAQDLRKPDGLLTAVQDLKTHLENSGKTIEEQAAIIDAAFGRSRSSSMVHLLVDEIGRLSSKYQQQAGIVGQWSEDVAKAESTVAARWDQFKEVLNTTIMMMASSLLPVMNMVIVALTGLMNAVGHITTAFPTLTGIVLAATIGLGALNVILIGGRVASSFYLLAMRNLFDVISHGGAVVNASVRSFGFLIGAETDSEKATKLRVLADKESVAAQELSMAKTKEAALVEGLKTERTKVLTATEDKQRAQLALMNAVQDEGIATTEKDALATEYLATKKALLAAQADYTAEAILKEQAATETATARSNLLNLAQERQVLTANLAAGSTGALAAAEGTEAEMASAAAASTAALMVAEDGEAVSAGTAAVATGFFAAAVDALAGGIALVVAAVGGWIVVIPALIALAGILAYNLIPAFHDTVVSTATAIKEDISQALTDMGKALGWVGDRLGDAGSAIGQVVGGPLSKLKDILLEIIKDAHAVASVFSGGFLAAFIAATGPIGLIIEATKLLHDKLQEQRNSSLLAASAEKIRMTALGVSNIVTGASTQLLAGNIAMMNRSSIAVQKLGADYDAMFREIEAKALAPLDAQLAASEARMSSYANAVVARTKQMADGMVAEIKRVRNELLKPLPEIALAGTSQYGNVAGTSSANMVKATSAGPALQLSADATNSLKHFQDAISDLPPKYRDMFSSVTDAYKAKLEDAYNTYVHKYNAENSRHESAIKKINDDYNAKVASARQAAQQKMDAEQTRYVDQVHGLNQTHESHLQNILQNFETNFQTVLANFQAQQGETQRRADAASQTHRDALQQLQAAEEAKMAAINQQKSKHDQQWLDDHKKALDEAYQREIKVEDTRYQRELGNIEVSAKSQSDAFNRHVQSMDAVMRNRIAQEDTNYRNAVAKADEGHKRNEASVNAILQQHVKNLHEILAQSVANEESAHKKHVEALLAAFESGAKKIGDSITKGISPADILSALNKSADKNYKDALEKATVDILSLGKATKDDITALQKAASERDRIAKASAKAEEEAHTSLKTFSDQLKDMTSKAQKDYDNAMAKTVVHILNEHKARQSDIEALQRAAAEREKISKAEAEAEKLSGTKIKEAATSLADELNKLTQKATKDYDNSLAALTLAILNHTGHLKKLTDQAIAEKEAKDRLAAAEAKAEALVAGSSHDLKTALDAATKAVDTDLTNIGNDLYKIMTGGSFSGPGAAGAGSFGRGSAGGLNGRDANETLDADLTKLSRDFQTLDAITRIETEAKLRAAKAEGDFATVSNMASQSIRDLTDKGMGEFITATLGISGSLDNAKKLMDEAAGKQEAYDSAKRAADEQWTQDTTKAALAAGDLATVFGNLSKTVTDDVTNSFDSIVVHFATGAGSLNDLVTTYGAAKQAQADWTKDIIKADLAIGDFTGAVNATKQSLDDGLNNAINKYAYDTVTGNTAAIADDTKEIKEHAKSVGDWTSATDKATAIANGDKTATVDQVVSAQQAVANDSLKVIEANTTVMADESSIQVAAVDAVTAAITDQTAIISAQGSVSKAQADGMVKMIQDQSSITQATAAIQNATTPQELAVARAQLKLAQDKMRFDQMASAAAVMVAQQQLRAAQDKAVEDARDQQLKQVVMFDQLKLDQDKVKLALDTLHLSEDQLRVLGDIDAVLGGQTDVQKMIAADQAQISKDNEALARDQQQMATDQAKQLAQEAADRQQQAQDAQNIELAKLRQTQIENQAAITEANDQAHIDSINQQQKAAKNTEDTVAAIKAMHDELADQIKKLNDLESRAEAGLARLDVTRQSPGTNIMDGWASDSARIAGAPG